MGPPDRPFHSRRARAPLLLPEPAGRDVAALTVLSFQRFMRRIMSGPEWRGQRIGVAWRTGLPAWSKAISR